MSTELLLAARFDYATSAAGQPHAAIRVHSRWVLSKMPVEHVIRDLVTIMDKAGSDYHHCPSMPSLAPHDYMLIRHEPHQPSLIVASSEQLANFAFEPTSDQQTIWLNLYYISEFGDRQREQCLRLGGSKSVRIAEAHCAAAQQFAAVRALRAG